MSKARSLYDINEEAINVLNKTLSIANTLRFVNQFTVGFGDYTEERKELFKDDTLDSLVAEIEANRREGF